MENSLQKLIEDSSSILITSHISADADAVCSSLIVRSTLVANYPNKKVLVDLEEVPESLTFLPGFSTIHASPLDREVAKFQPNLIIMLDANNFDRCSRVGAEKTRRYIEANDVKVAIIDHHQPEGKDDVDLYIGNDSPATTQMAYDIFFGKLKMTKPTGYAEIALLGIMNDTNRFLYDNPNHRQTFSIISDLLDAGASIEKLEFKLNRYTKSQLVILAELISNTVVEEGMTYSYLGSKFRDKNLKDDSTAADLKVGCDLYLNNYVRNFENNSWGFIVYPDIASSSGHWGFSARSVGGSVDVSKIAHKLGGGGHISAAGAKISAKTAQEALNKAFGAIGAKSFAKITPGTNL